MTTPVRWLRRAGCSAGCRRVHRQVGRHALAEHAPGPAVHAGGGVAYLNLLHAYVAASNSGSTDGWGARYATGGALDTLAKGGPEPC